MNFDRETKAKKWRKKSFFKQMVLEPLDIYMQNNKSRHSPYGLCQN